MKRFTDLFEHRGKPDPEKVRAREEAHKRGLQRHKNALERKQAAKKARLEREQKSPKKDADTNTLESIQTQAQQKVTPRQQEHPKQQSQQAPKQQSQQVSKQQSQQVSKQQQNQTQQSSQQQKQQQSQRQQQVVENFKQKRQQFRQQKANQILNKTQQKANQVTETTHKFELTAPTQQAKNAVEQYKQNLPQRVDYFVQQISDAGDDADKKQKALSDFAEYQSNVKFDNKQESSWFKDYTSKMGDLLKTIGSNIMDAAGYSDVLGDMKRLVTFEWK